MIAVMWLDALEPDAPDVVAAFRGIEAGRFISVRREVRRRGGAGSAGRMSLQLAAIAGAILAVVESLPTAAFAEPGGDDADARSGLAMAGALAASGRFPADAPAVVPGVPGERALGREALLRRIAASQRVVERAARTISGHEEDPCPLEHPLVGRLRCGEWLLFAGVHDLMHLEQLHGIAVAHGAEAAHGEEAAHGADPSPRAEAAGPGPSTPASGRPL
jgi:hypothetical protein